MPRIGDPSPPERDPALAAFLATFEDFKKGFSRAKTGSLGREYDGFRLTVFKSKRGDGYTWCIADDETGDKRFSKGTFETEEDAIDSVGSEFLF